MGAFAGRLGTRFLVVTVVPNALLLGYISFLLAAGAPAHSPSLARALAALDHLTANRIAAVILGLLIVSIASHPLQVPLIQLLEGYWWGLPFGLKLAYRATARYRNEWNLVQSELEAAKDPAPWDWHARNAGRSAQFRWDWLPEVEGDLLPTALGNTLRRGETRAGERYQLDLTVALPRLTPLMAPGVLAELSDLRNQLDAAARLCIAAGIATAVSVGLLIWHGPWLFLALATYLVTWACYRSAVAAARRFCISLTAAVDLCHLQLFDALSLERPADLVEERERNERLSRLFRGQLANDEMAAFRYVLPPRTDNPTAEGGTTTPPGQQ
ncbi:hypothetical protein [Trebonia sp.]|jgi:hypothetical protein|uniref:hypothetical protein n=1 Tax=Trebonia sp. TaxID=2767075 RepID=UPI003BB1A8FB